MNFSQKIVLIIGAATALCATAVLKQNTSKNNQQDSQSSTLQAPAVIQKDPLYWNWKSIDTTQIAFPKNFLWGVATSAHQTEGNCINNDWAAWEKTQKIAQTGGACNHWNTYKKDIQLIKQNKFNTYRFSIEWSKVEPKQGHWDEAALKHYEDVCKELIKQGIKPVITLHHYTNPIWFVQLGGFEKEKNIQYFVRYCTKVFERLNTYAHLWLTFNSPTSCVARAYHKKLAPPAKENMQLMQEVLKNMLEAHVQVYHTLKKLPHGAQAQIGICHNIYQIEPKKFWDKTGASIAYKLFNDNIYQFFKTGHFNASVPFNVSLKYHNPKAKGALDFIGLNYYSHGLMNNFNVNAHPSEMRTQQEMYTIYPEGFYRAIQEVSTEFAKPLKIPIYVTENGIATNNEKDRELFFQRYLYALSYAIHQGCPVKGYIVWSLLDNYEWGSYDMHYGIYSVDFKTQMRGTQPRAGAHYLINIVKSFETHL